MNRENHEKTYIIENNIVSRSLTEMGHEKKGGKKMRRIFHKLLKTHVEKMSLFPLSTILMKIKELVRRDKPAGSKG
ncbi:MAG TPA: hypothetical protein VKO18_21285 [Terriglobia bacterium]|nr:hypothetical protein [Terriglobia bacterium]